MNLEALVQALPEVLTQLLGFLLVFWVLKRTAFGAVFRILDERQKAITDSFGEIEKKKSDLDALDRDYRAKLQNIHEEARHKIQEALQEAGRMAQEIRDKARADSQRELERAKADIAQEIAKSRVEIRNEVVELASRMSEKIIQKSYTPREDEDFIEEILKEAQRI